MHNTSIVHNDVQSAVLGEGGVKCFLPGLDVGNIAGHCGDVAGWVGACYLVGDFGVDVHHNDLGTFGGVFLCYCWLGLVGKSLTRIADVALPAPKPTAPPVTMATLPANLPLGDVVTGVLSDVLGA